VNMRMPSVQTSRALGGAADGAIMAMILKVS
jgi:hypothetical protein